MEEYKALYDAFRKIRDLIQIQTTLMQAEVLHGMPKSSPSYIHVDSGQPRLPARVHIAVHRRGLKVIEGLSKPEMATDEEMMNLFVHILTGDLLHWEDLEVGELTASEIARYGLAKNPALLN